MTTKISAESYQSWGRYPQVEHKYVLPIYWGHALPNLATIDEPVLPYGFGRSYGDSCLNENGALLDVSPLNRLISFDRKKGLLRCEAGASLENILAVIVQDGWFLPVVPGTRFVSVGGAIANDIHGKNHHRAGTFGCHVKRFELLRSNGERFICSSRKNTALFRATIGGLGLTGLILWAEIQLTPITSQLIDVEKIRFRSLTDFFKLSAESDKNFEYTVAWIDCLATGANLGRGIFIRGNHHQPAQVELSQPYMKQGFGIPFDLPDFCLNRYSMSAFNGFYYRAQFKEHSHGQTPFDKFFFPLDGIQHWNRIYGRRGFLQYQCVIPTAAEESAIAEILTLTAKSGGGSFLAVLKRFGEIKSPGLLSFPQPGATLALDFAFRGQMTLDFLETLDTVVRKQGGAVYPAKDARMSAESFQAYFPQWVDFQQHVDTKFHSRFWHRVTQPANSKQK